MRFPTMCDQQRLKPACAYAHSDQSLCQSPKYFVIVKLLTEHHLEFLSFKGVYTGSTESTLVKTPHLTGVGDPFLEQNARYHSPIYCLIKFDRNAKSTFNRQICLYD